jgi:hypothetical protein
MNRRIHTFLALFLLAPLIAVAYPPAPPHEIYGLVRDEWGNPFTHQNAQIILETDNGTRITELIRPGLEPGANYRLKVPMDAGITPDLYQPTALRPFAPFRLQVRVGQATYLPIQMQGGYEALGRPAERTRLDLTLGLDSDGDGLPDAWKRMVMQMMGGGLTFADITPHGDLDGDGMSNFDEYIAGTYAWDSGDQLWLNIVEVRGDKAVLDFLAIDGRSYSIYHSEDLKEWAPVQFRVPATDPAGEWRAHFFAPEVRLILVEVPIDPEAGPHGFYRLKVQ